jgi:hypothetical protein
MTEELPVCEGCGEVPKLFDVCDAPGFERIKELKAKLLETDPENAREVFKDDDPPRYRCGCCVPLMTAEEYAKYNEEEKRKRQELGFVFRVSFGDNDFSVDVERACEDFLHNVSHGHVNSEGIEEALKKIETVGMENLRKYIVMVAFGYYITNTMRHWLNMAARGHSGDPYELKQYEHTLQYLDKNITLEKIEDYEEKWENSEVCYVDLTHHEVHLQ